jgi:hypothetical protein
MQCKSCAEIGDIEASNLQHLPFLSVFHHNRYSCCKIWSFQGCDYEECCLLGYKIPVRTSQEIYITSTELSRLMLCKIWEFHGGDCENAVFWDVKSCGSCKNQCFGGTHRLFITLFLVRRFLPLWWWRWYIPLKRRSYKSHTGSHPSRRHSSNIYVISEEFWVNYLDLT